MRPTILGSLVVACAISAGLAAQQPLVCAGGSSQTGRGCEAFHYHVQAYRPDTRGFAEFTAIPPFATTTSCDRAREAHVAANLKIVDYFKRVKQQQYEPDRVGPCHCDLTREKSSPSYLPDAQRLLQLRSLEDVRLRVREHMLDEGLTTESELIRNLYAEPPVTQQLGGPRILPMPTVMPPLATSVDELRTTRAVETTKPTAAAMDLPLVDVAVPAPEAPPPPQTTQPRPQASVPSQAAGSEPAEPAASSTPQTTETATPTTASPEPAPASTPAVTTATQSSTPAETAPALWIPAPRSEAQAPAAPEDIVSAQDTAEQFVTYETQRIQRVLGAASAIGDEAVKSKIFDACIQRSNLLSNLKLLIEGSGVKSRLAVAARNAVSEEERLVFISRLFGEKIRPHWAPKDASDVILIPDPEIDAEPERALRDTTGRVSTEQKRQALYLVLARTQPAEDQRLWLSTLIEGFLR